MYIGSESSNPAQEEDTASGKFKEEKSKRFIHS